MNIQLLFLSLLLFFTPLLPERQSGGRLTVEISNIRNSKGVIALAFFTSSDAFNKQQPQITKIVSKKNMVKGCVTATFTDIPRGVYGIALLDDENSNMKMDYRLFVPTEGFGFSNYEHTGMKMPKFERFVFTYDGRNKTVCIKIRYIHL